MEWYEGMSEGVSSFILRILGLLLNLQTGLFQIVKNFIHNTDTEFIKSRLNCVGYLTNITQRSFVLCGSDSFRQWLGSKRERGKNKERTSGFGFKRTGKNIGCHNARHFWKQETDKWNFVLPVSIKFEYWPFWTKQLCKVPAGRQDRCMRLLKQPAGLTCSYRCSWRRKQWSG